MSWPDKLFMLLFCRRSGGSRVAVQHMKPTLSLVLFLIIAGLTWSGIAVAEGDLYWPAAKHDSSTSRSRHEPLGAVWTVADEPEPAKPEPARRTVRSKKNACATRSCGKVAARVKAAPKPKPPEPKPPAEVVTKAAPAKSVPVPGKTSSPASSRPVSAATMADQIILVDAKRGCAARDADACLILGRMYVTGTAASKDAAAAARTFKQSCDLGSGAGCHALGLMHEKGSGTKANASEAVRYYRIACRRGVEPACQSAKRLSAKGPAVAFRLPDIFGGKAPAS